MYQKGTIEEIFPEKQVNDKFKTKRFALLIPDNSDNEKKYDQHVVFELINKKTELIKNFNVGDKVSVTFRLKGNKKQVSNTGENQYFNTIECLDIELI